MFSSLVSALASIAFITFPVIWIYDTFVEPDPDYVDHHRGKPFTSS